MLRPRRRRCERRAYSPHPPVNARSYEKERQSLDPRFLAKASGSAPAARPEAAARRRAGLATRARGEAALDVLEIRPARFLVVSQSSVEKVASRSAEGAVPSPARLSSRGADGDEGSCLRHSRAGYEHRRRDPSSLSLLGMTSCRFHWQHLPPHHSYWMLIL